jgi:hypothetical protein
LQKNIITEFDKELVSLSDNSTISFEWLRPNFTQGTFAEIQASTESKATERQSYEEELHLKRRIRDQYTPEGNITILLKRTFCPASKT